MFPTTDMVFHKPKIFFFFFFLQNRSDFLNIKSCVLHLKKTYFIFFTNQVLFILIHKIDLIFLDKILLFTLYKKKIYIYLIFLTNQVLFILIHKTNLIFLLKEDIIHKANLFEFFFFVKCLSFVFNISFNIIKKWYIGH